MSESSARTTRASATREVAYPVAHVWQAMATLLPYCSVCDVSAVIDSPGELGVGTAFRAFSGRIDSRTDGQASGRTDGQPGGPTDEQSAGRDGGEDGSADAIEGGMPGEIVEWSPQRSVATRLKAGQETVVVRVEMAPATPDTTLVTISVEVTPRMRGRLAAAMTRSSYARMARLTVEGEIEKLPAHLALFDQPDEVGQSTN